MLIRARPAITTAKVWECLVWPLSIGRWQDLRISGQQEGKFIALHLDAAHIRLHLLARSHDRQLCRSAQNLNFLMEHVAEHDQAVAKQGLMGNNVDGIIARDLAPMIASFFVTGCQRACTCGGLWSLEALRVLVLRCGGSCTSITAAMMMPSRYKGDHGFRITQHARISWICSSTSITS